MAVTDFLTYIGYPYPDDHFREDNPVNLFGVPAFCAEANLSIQHVFLQLVKNSDWPRRQKELWIQRYMLGRSIDSAARYMKRTPAWVEEKYRLCQERLAEMVRAWWAERLSDNPEKHLPEMLHTYIVELCEQMED